MWAQQARATAQRCGQAASDMRDWQGASAAAGAADAQLKMHSCRSTALLSQIWQAGTAPLMLQPGGPGHQQCTQTGSPACRDWMQQADS